MQKKKKFSKSTLKYIFILAFLAAVNLTLGIVLTSQSAASMKELIDQRMLDIVNTAAAMADGDILDRVSPADKGTPEYESVMKSLTYFLDNIELEYIYCIKDTGDGNFVFGLDPDPVDPAVFGSPIEYTDALYSASLGTAAVDSQPYSDRWGTFYSAYSPVFNSEGKISCIIAVDFSKDWYDRQLNKQSNTVIIVMILSISLSGAMAYFMRLGEKRQRILSDQLSATSDIYMSMYELNLPANTFSEVYSNRNVGKTGVAAAQTIHGIYEKATDPSSRALMLKFVDFTTLNERLKDTNTITNEFLSIEGKWRRARFIVFERSDTGDVIRAMYLVEDIDAEKKEHDMTLDALRLMNEQISTVANIYFSMHDIDLTNNTIREVRTHVTNLSRLFTKPVENAQQAALTMIDGMTSDISRQTMHEFMDFSTLDKRFSETNTLTEEFLTVDNEWCRARFLISKCGDDGSIEHVMWLIESIDEEKRRRDILAETAQMLGYRISSIANIYMTVQEIDLDANRYTAIKSDSKYLNDIAGESHSHAQESIRGGMAAVTDDSCIDDIMTFMSFSTLGERLRNTNTIAIEFLNTDKQWRRGRFVASRRDAAGELTHVLWLTEDIDEEKKARDRLVDMSERALAASEAKSSFLSNMSHEIRTPINAVLGMNEMILRECEDKNILAYSNSIRTAGSTLLGLVNDILDFSKIEAGKMEIIPVDYDLSSVINDLVNMIQTKADDKGLVLELDISRSVPKLLHGDEVRLKQIITNLLTNAVKYTEEGSVTFCIDYANIPDEPECITLIVEVIDTGIGIKKEDLHKLFSKFDRIEEERNRHVEGTGLGMSITKRLLEMMDSSLVVESIYGMGSKFSFELKQTVVKWEELGDYQTAYKASLGMRQQYREKFRAPSAQVLVVDDTPMNLVVFRSLLKQTGVKIDTANSGDEGLKMSYDKKYDMIFLDHMMPEKDGIETLHELRSRPKDPNLKTPTVCLTANAISGAREQYLAEGFDDYLTKPIDPEKLENMLLVYLPEDKIEKETL